MKTPPIKRNKNIQVLSREHHHGLLLCWKIKEGKKRAVDPRRIVAYINFFWDNHLKNHFKEEEDLLFSLVEDNLCTIGFSQHKNIRSLLERVNESPDNLDAFIEHLEAHIRFEERELFPHLEQILTDQQLLEIGSALEASHEVPFIDNYQDEFWKN